MQKSQHCNRPAFMTTFAGETLRAWKMASWTCFVLAVAQVFPQGHKHTLFIIQVCLLPPIVDLTVILVHKH